MVLDISVIPVIVGGKTSVGTGSFCSNELPVIAFQSVRFPNAPCRDNSGVFPRYTREYKIKESPAIRNYHITVLFHNISGVFRLVHVCLNKICNISGGIVGHGDNVLLRKA